MATEEKVRIRIENKILGDRDWGLFSREEIEDMSKIKNICAQMLARNAFRNKQSCASGMWRVDYVG